MSNRKIWNKSPTYRVIVAIVFGLLGFAVNFVNIQLFASPNFKVSILLGLLFPLIIALAWGWKYGLLSALAGGCQSMWWLWQSDGWGILYSVPVFSLWIVWHGWWADRRRKKESWRNSMFVVELPFRVMMELGFYTVFRALVSLNPPPWNGDITWNNVPLSWVNSVAIKHFIVGYIILIVAYVILDLGPVRRFFGLNKSPVERETTVIYAGGILMGLALWTLDSVVAWLAFHRAETFWQVAVLNVGQHELFMRLLYLLASLIAAAFIAHVARQRAVLTERSRHLNSLLSAIRNVNQLIVSEKDREQLLQGTCERLVHARGYFNAWIATLNESGALELAVESGLGDSFGPMLERLRRGEIPACGGQVMTTQGLVVVSNPENDCFECPLSTSCGGRAGAAVRLAYAGEQYGFLVVSTQHEYATDEEERSLLVEIAGDLSFALHSIEVEEERKQTGELYQLIVENAHSGIILVDDQYHLLWVNDQFCEISGWNKAESIGHDFRDFLDAESRQLVTERYCRRQRGENVPARYEFNLLRKDKEKRRVELRAAVARDSAGRMRTIGQILDITERVRAQEQLRAENQMTLALSRSAAAIVSSLDTSKVLDRILEELQRVVRADAGSVMLVERDTVRVVGARAYSDSAGNYDVFGHTFVISDTPALRRMMDAGSPIIITDTRASAEWVQLPGLEWQRSYAGIPIRVHDKTLGFLNIDRSTPGPFDPQTIERLQVFASIAGAAIENAALLKEANLRAEQRGVLSELGRDLASALDLHTIYRTASSYVTSLVDCDNFAISLFDAKKGILMAGFLLSAGEEIDVSQLPPLENPPNAKNGRAGAINLRRALIVNGLADKARRSKRVVHVESDREPQSAIYLPMIVENEVIGLVEVQSYKDHAYSDGDLPLLSMAVNQVGLAIRNAQLFADTERSQEELREYSARLETAQRVARMGFLDWDLQTNKILLSDELRRMYGLDQDKRIVTREAVIATIHKDDLEHISENVNLALAGEKDLDIDHRIVLPDGKVRWLHADGQVIRDAAGKPMSMVATVIDITPRKEVEGRLRKSLEDIMRVLSLAIEIRDPYTAGHQLRVAKLAVSIAAQMGLPEDTIEGIRLAAQVHDIGKLAVPAEILAKPTGLNDIEFSLIKEHPQVAYDVLKDIDFPGPIAEIVLQHHERVDGSGYPNGLKGDEIILEARILAVADVVEAMSSHRPYRPALGLEAALDEIKKKKGRFYDPAVVDACLTVSEQGFSFE